MKRKEQKIISKQFYNNTFHAKSGTNAASTLSLSLQSPSYNENDIIMLQLVKME